MLSFLTAKVRSAVLLTRLQLDKEEVGPDPKLNNPQHRLSSKPENQNFCDCHIWCLFSIQVLPWFHKLLLLWRNHSRIFCRVSTKRGNKHDRFLHFFFVQQFLGRDQFSWSSLCGTVAKFCFFILSKFEHINLLSTLRNREIEINQFP